MHGIFADNIVLRLCINPTSFFPVQRIGRYVLRMTATPLSTIFQLYIGGQFYWWRKLVCLRENHWPVTSHWQSLSHNVVSSTSCWSRIRTHNFSGDCSICVVLLCVFTFWVPCWDVHYNIHIKTSTRRYYSETIKHQRENN
jgi:hypothetical protein